MKQNRMLESRIRDMDSQNSRLQSVLLGFLLWCDFQTIFIGLALKLHMDVITKGI